MTEDNQELLLLLCSGDLSEPETRLLEQRMEEDPALLEQVLELQHLGWFFSTSLERKHDENVAQDLRTHVMRIIDAESDTLVAQRVHNVIQQESKKKRRKKSRAHTQPQPSKTIERTSQSWWRGLSAVAAAMLIMAGVGSYLYYNQQNTPSPATQPHITGLNLKVLKLQGNAYLLNQPDQPLQAGKHYTLEGIELDAGSYLTAKLDDGSQITLRDATRLHYQHEKAHAFNLETGSITAHVTPQNEAFTIQTRGAMIQVVGTIFEVTHTREQTYVGVEEGHVQVINKAGDIRDITGGNGIHVSDEGHFSYAPSLNKFERTISYEQPLGTWTSGVWQSDPNAPSGGFIRSLEQNRYGLRYALVSDNYYAPDPIVHFTSGQIVEITYRANAQGSFKLQFVPKNSIPLRPEYFIHVAQEDIGRWKTIRIPMSQFDHFKPEVHNLEICRRLLIGSVDIPEFDISRIEITVP